jgi:hypothetical protein
MSYTVLIDGIPVECASAREALELVRLHKASSPSRPLPLSREDEASPDEQRDVRFLAILRLIQRAGNESVPSKDLIGASGVATGKGLGGFLTAMNARIRDLGFETDEVYTKRRTAEGSFFSPCPKLGVLIRKMEGDQ